MYYLNSRWYDSQNARFISEDTHRGYHPGDALSLNMYTYVRNNPMTRVDPSGHCDMCSFHYGDYAGYGNYSDGRYRGTGCITRDQIDTMKFYYWDAYYSWNGWNYNETDAQWRVNAMAFEATGFIGQAWDAAYNAVNGVDYQNTIMLRPDLIYTLGAQNNSLYTQSTGKWTASDGTLHYVTKSTAVFKNSGEILKSSKLIPTALAGIPLPQNLSIKSVHERNVRELQSVIRDVNAIYNSPTLLQKIHNGFLNVLDGFGEFSIGTFAGIGESFTFGMTNSIPYIRDKQGNIYYIGKAFGNTVANVASKVIGQKAGSAAIGGTIGSGGTLAAVLVPAGAAAVVYCESVSVASIAFASSNFGKVDFGKSGGSGNNRGVGGKGWEGDKAWKNNVDQVKKGGTIENFNGNVASEAEARRLIEQSGGTINRVEGAHPKGGVSNHNYPHINYTTSSGVKGTIKIK